MGSGIQRDTIEKRVVRILLECFLVWHLFYQKLHGNERKWTRGWRPYLTCIVTVNALADHTRGQNNSRISAAPLLEEPGSATAMIIHGW